MSLWFFLHESAYDHITQREENIDYDAWNIQHHTNLFETSYCVPLREATWPKNHYPTYIPLFQHWHFSFPVDISFGWPPKSVTHHYQHKYWNIFFISWCHYHSTHVKFPKINSFLSIQLWTFFFSNSQILIFTDAIVWTFCFLIQLLNFSLVFLFVLQLCFVLALQPYAWYNSVKSLFLKFAVI